MAEGKGRFRPIEALDRLKDFFTVERVFGKPIEVQGRTIIPVIRMGAGGGGGGGEGEGVPAREEGSEPTSVGEPRETAGQGVGMGFGFGGSAKPIGVLVVEEGETIWLPILDSERVALKALGVAMAAVKVAGTFARKAKAARRKADKGRGT